VVGPHWDAAGSVSHSRCRSVLGACGRVVVVDVVIASSSFWAGLPWWRRPGQAPKCRQWSLPPTKQVCCGPQIFVALKGIGNLAALSHDSVKGALPLPLPLPGLACAAVGCILALCCGAVCCDVPQCAGRTVPGLSLQGTLSSATAGTLLLLRLQSADIQLYNWLQEVLVAGPGAWGGRFYLVVAYYLLYASWYHSVRSWRVPSTTRQGGTPGRA